MWNASRLNILFQTNTIIYNRHLILSYQYVFSQNISVVLGCHDLQSNWAKNIFCCSECIIWGSQIKILV